MDGFLIDQMITKYGINETDMMLKNNGMETMKYKVLRDIINQAHKEALLKGLKTRLHMYYEDYLDSNEFLEMFPFFKECKDKAEKLLTKYIFLTVNPEPTISLKMFRDIIEKVVKKKWMLNYIYVIEQRGNTPDEMGRGFHCHFLIDVENKKHSEAIRELKNTFKKVCDVSYSSCFNIKNIKEEHLKRVIKYITGVKKDAFKHPKQLIDRVFRDTNHISKYYHRGELNKLIEINEEVEESLGDLLDSN